MHQPQLESQDVRLLMEVGMLGAGAGAQLHAAVEQLFSALMVLRPEHDFAYIGQASAWLNQGRTDEAVTVLEQGLRLLESTKRTGAEADRDMLRAFLGLALSMGKRPAEAQQELTRLLRTGSHPQALRMARGLLGLPQTSPYKEEFQ
jgi:hypothetical protein